MRVVRVVRAVRRVWSVRMIVRVVIVRIVWVSPAPRKEWVIETYVPMVVPTIAVRVAPTPIWICPIVVPRIGRHYHSAPRAEHRGYIFRLDPYLVARDHDVVERRVIGRRIEECVVVSVGVV